MNIKELWKDTIDLTLDTNEDSYPLDFFMREINSLIKLYHPRVLNWDRDYNEYYKLASIELFPEHLLKRGMEGYKGRYSLPPDLHEFIRVEISKDGKCDFRKATKKDINENPDCTASEAWDECCNKNVKCCDGDCACYHLEDNLIALNEYPKKRGMMKIFYLRKPMKLSDKQREIDFVEGFEDILGLEASLRYARRHTGQFSKIWFEETKYELGRRAIELQRHLKNRYGKDGISETVPLTV